MPGHSYFLGKDEDQARANLRTSLAPLFAEYLAQGYVSRFAESIRGYVQWLEVYNARGRARATRHRARANSPPPAVRPTQEIFSNPRITAASPDQQSSSLEVATLQTHKAQAARLAEQFIQQNSPLFQLLQVDVRRDYDGADVLLNIESHGAVGAVPLCSPLTARHDFGLVVQPRFSWAGIGPLLAEMGWLISPSPLILPLLKRIGATSPVVGPVVHGSCQIQTLLDRLDRRFEVITETRPAPKARIEWTEYATCQMPRGDFLSLSLYVPGPQG